MKNKKIFLIFVFMLIVLMPLKVFGLTGSLYGGTDVSYKAKIINPNGATVYADGNWCPGCGTYKAFTIKYGEIVDVIDEIFDYYKYIDDECKDNYCSFLGIKLGNSEYSINNSEYKKLLDEAIEYEDIKESDLMSNISHFFINYKDVELVNSIKIDNDYIGKANIKLYKYGNSNVNVYKEPSIMSDTVSVINSDKLLDKATKTYFSSWYYIDSSSTKGWVNVDNTDSLYLFKSTKESIDDVDQTYKNIQIKSKLEKKIGTNTYIIPKNKVFDEFYYNLVTTNKIVPYNGDYILFNNKEYKNCYNNSCKIDKLKIEVKSETTKSVSENETTSDSEVTNNDVENTQVTENKEIENNLNDNEPITTIGSDMQEDSNNSNLIIMILSCLVVVLLAIVIVLLINNKKKKNQSV